MKALDKIREIVNKFSFNIREAQEIICHVLKIDKIQLYTENPEITSEQAHTIKSLIERRLKKEPLQYIIGECYFYNIKIKVGRGVLIPRPETEILVEQVLERQKLISNTGNRILDLCTGSGCIALAIGKNAPEFQIFGIDKSEKAVKYATENKALNNIKNVIFLVGDMFNPFKEKIFACITANPPYVKTDEISKLQPEIKNYEPLEALNGGEDGLNFYRKIIENAEKYLLNSGLIFLEIGQGQAKAVQNIALMSGFNVIEVVKDIAGIDRVMILQKSKSL
ncbi:MULTISPECIES: peptide chain release factor N(5)-glutamine methyltransferase [Thermodesulfovibrio]|uniref:Release factor glutamine methyltransferase n=1 Tax=Thermodesulfovibrio yellowstonii (strain ATCC 51303 / DSM 11347 / YP87) TaxID=289376 RepID=PRMC_THEYD|nr:MULTISPECIES: peptide chain release factor N(5)-glutamine methyltransferase [Thermodesulfovibrio]B5YIQ8.1 RecName: Full=Release factor glutamine methyltransferase; Short=RF MTase; AltName: Full=N5-glutamine methyltransferase PrmC; AltName: Full=Protein-(glutamine-N5) MTase PrmC; AltName: Full=Protein-glutamine N-methyltransferase PrmC [Thermodesulfovibrio yellowstonii DSM 11347]ACI22032.1 HemK family protein [Thermodesulfovibrio yellowstonii DSM 11347]